MSRVPPRWRTGAGAGCRAGCGRPTARPGPQGHAGRPGRGRRRRGWPAPALTADQLAALLSSQGRTAAPATIDRALAELAAAGAAIVEHPTERWILRPATQHPLLEAVDLHGAHDFRHTFSTWLEDAGIPARVIDELMGHQATGRAGR